MNMQGPLKTFVAVMGMACVIVCGGASPTFAQQPPVASVVQSLPRDTSGAYLVSTPRGVPIATINVTATDPDPCDLVGFYARPAHPMPSGLVVTDHGVANPACTPGVVFAGTISGTPTEQGTFTSVLQADGLTPLATFIWTITNASPAIDPIDAQTFAAGQPIAMAVHATDANGDSLRFAATNLPVGLIINPWSGVISGSAAATGTFAPVITVTDGHAGTATQSFTLTVTGTAAASSCTPANRVPGPWCAGDLFLGLGTSQYGPRLDGEGHPALDSDGNPIMEWTIARPGEFAIHDARGASLQSAVFDSSLAVTAACVVDPVSGGLWSSGESTNLISHLAAPTATLAPQRFAPIDISSYVRTSACDTDSVDPLDGCGAAQSLVFDRQGHLYVGTVDGTNTILKFNQDGTFLASYRVPLGSRGPGWIDLAADQETIYYASGDHTIRLFNVNGTPLPQALFDAGVEHLWDPVLDPSSLGLFGQIVVKNYSGDPIPSRVLGVRVLPPGDGSGGLVVLHDVFVQRIDLGGHFLLGVSPEYLSLHAFALTPDGKSVWTITNAGGHSGLVKSHLPTATTDRGPLRTVDSPIVNAICVNNGYTAALTQPDCSADPTNSLCRPLPVCAGGGPGPDCVPPRTPSIEQPADRENDEGDTIAPITVTASDPNNSPLTYAVNALPQGLTFDPVTHVISGTIGWRASDVLGTPATHVRVMVTNAEGLFDQKWFDWTLHDKNAPPSASVAPPPVRDASGAYLISTPRGVPISPLALTATDPDPCDGVGFYARPASPMPPGVAVIDDAVTPTCSPGVVFSGAIVGTPTTLGTFTSVVQANAATPLATFVWTVTNTAPTLDAIADQSVTAGTAVSMNANAADENHDTLTFAASGLPAGITIDPATGTVSGATTATGDHTVTVTVADGHGGTASVSFLLAVGTLGPPIAIPPAGVYGAHLSVALVAPAGAVVRYTLDESTPSANSSIYSEAIPLTTTTTLKAAAFADGLDPSPVLSAAYTIDASGPVIVPRLSPAPNEAGWNNTPVTVSFTCSDTLSGVGSCPSPLTFDVEGVQQVTVVATDLVGNATPQSITVNIDRIPATVALSSPRDGLTTNDASVAVTGHVMDMGSRVRNARCNDRLASVDGDTVVCTVALNPGLNTVILHAVDNAGNSSSAGIRIVRGSTQSQLAVVPNRQRLVLGESRQLQAATDAEIVAIGVTWTSSDPTVVSLAEDGTLTASGLGDATITAHFGALSAEATISVIGSSAAEGSAGWSVDPANGMTLGSPIRAYPTDQDRPDLFATESLGWDAATGVIRALRADGTLVFTQTTSDKPLFGDNTSGGLIALSSPWGWGGWYGTGITRIPVSEADTPWRYDAEESPAGTPPIEPNVSQSADGTVHLIENHYKLVGDGITDFSSDSNGWLVGVDGKSGTVRFRTPLPVSTVEYKAPSCLTAAEMPGEGNKFDDFHHRFRNRGLRSSESSSRTSNIAFSHDGFGYFVTSESFDSWRPVCHIVVTPPCGAFCGDGWSTQVWDEGSGAVTHGRELKLQRVDANGGVTATTLWSSFLTAPDTEANLDGGESATPGFVNPDGLGGVLVSWTYWSPTGPSWRITRIFDGGISTHLLTVPPGAGDLWRSPVVLVDDSGIAYMQLYNADWVQYLAAVDIRTWATKWTRETSSVPVMSLDNGNVVLNGVDESALIEVDQRGENVAITPLAVSLVDPRLIVRGQSRLHGLDAAGAITEVTTAEYVESAWLGSWSMDASQWLAGGCQTPPPLEIASAERGHKSFAPRDEPYTYRWLVSSPVRSDRAASVARAFTLWGSANAKTGLATQFSAASAEGTGQNIQLRTTLLPPDPTTGREVGGAFVEKRPLLPDGHIDGGSVFFTTKTDVLDSDNGYLKVGLHEIGHGLGLDHLPNSVQGRTVMNGLNGKDDHGGSIPRDVTACDRKAAKEYSTR